MLAPASQLTLTIEKPAVGGRMIARQDGEVVFVSGAIPGERVRARVEGYGRGVAHASVTEVLEASRDRRTPAGDPACGGNVFAHIAYPRQLSLKREILRDAFARLARVPLPDEVPVAGSVEHGYRLRARLHGRRHRLGFFRENSHDLCDPAITGQLLPETCRVIANVARRLDHVAALELSENLDASQRALHLDMREWGRAALEPLDGVAELPGVTGVTWSRAPAKDAERSRRTETRLVGGVPFVSDPVARVTSWPMRTDGATATLRRHATAFFQGNRFLLPVLTDAVVGAAGEGPVVDLYSGVGLFAVALAAVGVGPAIAVEADPGNVEDLMANALPFAEVIRIEHASVEAFLARGDPAASGTVIVDPPRSGISRDAMAGIIASRPRRVVYVSCDVATLARDVRALAARGYRLARAEGFDLFPNTAHLETLIVLER